MLDKKLIIEELKGRLETELSKAKEAFDSSHKLATGEEMKAESKYDTRGIEAGYLAGAQKRRVEELEQELKLLDEVELGHNTDSVTVGSLVKIKLNNQERLYFISSTSGGTILNIENQPILVISAFSPIGSEVIGLGEGETFEVESKGEMREYLVVSFS